MIPSRRQWQNWSLPSRLTFLGTLVGLLGLVVTVLPLIWSYAFPKKTPPDLYLTFFGEELPQFGFGDLGPDLAPPPSSFRYPATAPEGFLDNTPIGRPDGWQSTGALPISLVNLGEQTATDVSVRIDMDGRIGLFMLGTDRCDRGISPNNSVVSVRFVGGQDFEVPGQGEADSYCLVTISVPPIPRDYQIEYFVSSAESSTQKRQINLVIDTQGTSDDLVENARGLDAYSKRDLPKAKTHFQNALILNPKLDAALFNLGLVQLIQNDWQGAVESYMRLSETKSDFFQVWGNLGAALLSIDEFDCAATSMRKALEINPESEIDIHNLERLLASETISEVNIDTCRRKILRR